MGDDSTIHGGVWLVGQRAEHGTADYVGELEEVVFGGSLAAIL